MHQVANISSVRNHAQVASSLPLFPLFPRGHEYIPRRRFLPTCGRNIFPWPHTVIAHSSALANADQGDVLVPLL